MSTFILACISSVTLSVALGYVLIPLLRKIKAGQQILKYVQTHKDKNGTPTMGGLFFIASAVIIFIIFGGLNGRVGTVAMAIGLAFMLVGFIDDFIKVKLHRNEGLKAYQKILFQIGIAVLAGVFSYVNGITSFNIPFTYEKIDLGWWTVPIVALIFIAITNSVNLTDGLDGLAGSVSGAYLICMVALMSVQYGKYSANFINKSEYESLLLLSTCLIGAILGFLVFNTNKAKVFMGDTGSLSLGGFLGSISIFSLNSFFIPIIGIMFALSSISVIVQVLHYKRRKRRVFLMAPLHHHFQLKGYTEAQITYCYSLITLLIGGVCVACAL